MTGLAYWTSFCGSVMQYHYKITNQSNRKQPERVVRRKKTWQRRWGGHRKVDNSPSADPSTLLWELSTFTWLSKVSFKLPLSTHLPIKIVLSRRLVPRFGTISPSFSDHSPEPTLFYASFRSLKTAFFSLGLSHWKRFWLMCTAKSAIQMYR